MLETKEFCFDVGDHDVAERVNEALDHIFQGHPLFYYDEELGMVPRIAGGYVTNRVQQFLHNPPIFSSSAAKVQSFLSGSRDLIARNSYLLLITDGGEANETVTSLWQYRNAANSGYATISAGHAADVGVSPVIAEHGVFDAHAAVGGPFEVEIPALREVINTLTPAGTTPTFRVYAMLEYLPV